MIYDERETNSKHKYSQNKNDGKSSQAS